MKRGESSDVTIVKRSGISVRIRVTTKSGVDYFVVDYRLKGERKLVWRSTLDDARDVANEAIDKIANGEAEVLNLTSSDRHVYLRATTALTGIEKQLDDVCREYAEAHHLLKGRASILETARDWLRRHNPDMPKITVIAAAELLKKQAFTDGKSKERLKQLNHVLSALGEGFNIEVSDVTPDLLSRHLAALPGVERTKRNHRDVLGFFNRWLVLRGYLAKGTDWLDGVQKYSARKVGEIEIYTPQEIARLLDVAGDMTPFFALGAFAGMRHAEIDRTDWSQIDLDDGFIEVTARAAKKKVRRLVPIKANLKKWLQPYRQLQGRVAKYNNTTKQLLKVAAHTKCEPTKNAPELPAIEWKHNALRHSFISYRVAECADVPRVAEEAGTSPEKIRTNYLRRVKPAVAADWFGVVPKKQMGRKKQGVKNET